MSLVFNHDKETLTECMGFTDNQLEELSEKLTEITKTFITTEKMKKSELSEQLALSLSYSELVFIVTHKVLDAAQEAVALHNKSVSGIEELLEALKKFKDGKDDQD